MQGLAHKLLRCITIYLYFMYIKSLKIRAKGPGQRSGMCKTSWLHPNLRHDHRYMLSGIWHRYCVIPVNTLVERDISTKGLDADSAMHLDVWHSAQPVLKATFSYFYYTSFVHHHFPLSLRWTLKRNRLYIDTNPTVQIRWYLVKWRRTIRSIPCRGTLNEVFRL